MDGYFSWLFDGIGSTILGLIISFIVGGIGGFALGRFSKSKQLQKAGKNAKQNQSMEIENEKLFKKKKMKENNTVIQKQFAGDKAEQTQTGRITHGK